MDKFWALIKRVRSQSTDESMAQVLASELARLPIPRIVEFHCSMLRVARVALTWDLWGAATMIHGGSCSQDEFCYFRLWIIAQGNEVFSRAVNNPDTLANHSKIINLSGKRVGSRADSDFPQMEELMYAAEQAFDHIVNKFPPKRAAQIKFPEELEERPDEVPPGQRWNFSNKGEIGRRFPLLTRLFSMEIQ
ncbi:DUF4240 domain-containing protein [Streptosporangium sp. NBC_01755]